MANSIRSFANAQRGTSAIEFALVLPVMLVFMAGIVELGRAYQAYSAVNRLATRYAIAWADCSGAGCGTELPLYSTSAALQNFVPQLTSSALAIRMMQITMSSSCSSTAASYSSSYNPSSASALTPTASECAIAQNAIASGQTGVIVTVSYDFTPTFFSSVMPAQTFTYTVAQDQS